MTTNSQWHWQEPGTAWRGCGIYHITLTQTNRTKALLGHLTDSPTAAEAAVERTELGNAIVEQFLAIPTHRPEVKPLAFCLMPDHFHGVIYVTSEMQSGIMSLVRGFWQGCKKIGSTYSASIFSASSSSLSGDLIAAPHHLWDYDPIFHEMPYVVPLAGQGQLESMIRYVHDNPRRAWLKDKNKELFKMRREIRISHDGANMVFSALGNMFLLDWPIKQLVECSRTIPQERLSAQLQAVMKNAGQGYVTITAAINEGEKTIAKTVREAGLPMIVLLKDGFPQPDSEQERFFKPHGVFFEACAAGKLLLLEPSISTFNDPVVYRMTQADLQQKAEAKHHDYTPLPTDSLRYRFVALNNMGKLIAEGKTGDTIAL